MVFSKHRCRCIIPARYELRLIHFIVLMGFMSFPALAQWYTNGRPQAEALHLTERFRRKDFGHMEVEITIDDPKAYTKPLKATIKQHLLPDTDLLEFVCEQNLDVPHLVGK